MDAVDDTEVLDLWDRLATADGPDRSRALADVAAEGSGGGDASSWPLGRVHEALLRLHVALAGPVLRSTVACPRCTTTIEFDLDATTLLTHATGESPATPVELDGWHVDWSPLTFGAHLDLADGRRAPEATDLVRAVVDEVKSPDGTPAAAEDLPAPVVAALAEAQLAADPLVEVAVALACSECGADTDAVVDLVAHVSQAVEVRGRRLLDDVHELATAYGWSERTVVSLPARRRRAYLERVRGTS